MVFDSVSMVRRKAACAGAVIESASSRMTIFNGGQGLPSGRDADAASCANDFTFSRMTLMPRSSEAFSSRTRSRYSSGPNSWRAAARIADVLPATEAATVSALD